MWPILTHFRMHTYIAHMYEWNETLCANGTQNSPRFFFNHFDCVIISQSQGFFPGFFLLYLIFVLFRCVDAWKKNEREKKTDRTGGGKVCVRCVCGERVLIVSPFCCFISATLQWCTIDTWLRCWHSQSCENFKQRTCETFMYIAKQVSIRTLSFAWFRWKCGYFKRIIRIRPLCVSDILEIHVTSGH